MDGKSGAKFNGNNVEMGSRFVFIRWTHIISSLSVMIGTQWSWRSLRATISHNGCLSLFLSPRAADFRFSGVRRAKVLYPRPLVWWWHRSSDKNRICNSEISILVSVPSSPSLTTLWLFLLVIFPPFSFDCVWCLCIYFLYTYVLCFSFGTRAR